MDGITILNTSEYFVKNTGGFNIIFLLCLIVTCVTMFFTFFVFKSDCYSIAGVLLAMTVLGVVQSIYLWKGFGGERITIPEYKVTIDSSITYKDFTNKYKVIGQEGQIYTIIDKEELAAAEKK